MRRTEKEKMPQNKKDVLKEKVKSKDTRPEPQESSTEAK